MFALRVLEEAARQETLLETEQPIRPVKSFKSSKPDCLGFIEGYSSWLRANSYK